MAISAVVLLAVALGMDAFSMAIGLGITGVRPRQILLISGVVCIFHVLMPLAGWTLGAIVGSAVGRFAGLAGAAVLIFIGLAGIWEVIKKRKVTAEMKYGCEASVTRINAAKGSAAVFVLAGSVSLDALSVGFGLGTAGTSLWLMLIFFGAVAGLMTAGGGLFGQSLGRRLGNKADLAGAVILLLIGVKMLFS